MSYAPLQPINELEQWHTKPDPWGYETNPDDRSRKSILLSEIPRRPYARVLDIGCGQGFVTRDLPGDQIVGVDISQEAINRAQERPTPRVSFRKGSLFELPTLFTGEKFDLIVITGVLYSQYIGHSNSLVYLCIDSLLAENGVLVSVHIDQWYNSRFPYLLIKNIFYQYREYTHNLEVYAK